MPNAAILNKGSIYKDTQKPSFPTRVDPRQPLTSGLIYAGLFNEGGNHPLNLANNDRATINYSTGGYPLWQVGKWGSNLLFNGITTGERLHNIVLPANSVYAVQQHSIVAWVRTGSFVGNVPSAGAGWSLVSRSNDITAGGFEWAVNENAGNPRLAFAYYNGAVQGWYMDGTNIASAAEYFLVGTWDGTSSRYYLNGLLSSTATTAGGTISYSGSDNLQIGYEGNFVSPQNGPWEGSISQVLVYNRVLSLSEIQALWANPYVIYKPLGAFSIEHLAPTAAPPSSIWIPFPKRNEIALRTSRLPRYERFNRIRAYAPYRQPVYGQWPQGTVSASATIVNRPSKILTGLINAASLSGTLLTQVFRAIPALLTTSRAAFRKQVVRQYSPVRTRIHFAIFKAGATQYTQTNTGTVTSSATIVNLARNVKAGTINSFGTIVNRTNKAFTGAITSISGTIVKLAQKVFTGLLIESGALAIAKVIVQPVSGTLTSAGALTKRAIKPALSGLFTPSGVVIKRALKAFTGAIASSGAIVTTKAFVRTVSGTLTSSATIVQRTSKILTAQIISTGTPAQRVAKSFGGTVTSSGVVSRVKVLVRTFTGALNSSGALRQRANQNLTSQINNSATLGFIKPLRLVGQIIATGSVNKFVSRSLSGLLSTITSTLDMFAHHGVAVQATPEYIAFELPLAEYIASDTVLAEYLTTDKVLV